MNAKQTTAVSSLVALLSTIRGLNATPTTDEQDGKVLLDLGLTGFPLVSIGKQGGYGLPDVKSYPENGKPSNHAFPGNSALDAALWGDMHVVRQAAGRVRKATTASANGTVASSPELDAAVSASDAASEPAESQESDAEQMETTE